jgi:hypothetical protein
MDDRPVTRLFLMTAGLFAWGVQFTLAYGVTSVSCARGYASLTLVGIGLVPASILAATLLTLLPTLWLLVYALREHRRLRAENAPANDRFLMYSTITISSISAVAIVYGGMPALLLPPCS